MSTERTAKGAGPGRDTMLLATNPLLALLVGLSLAAVASAQHDPIKDFCRRFGHAAAVVDDRMYINGGHVNWKPLTASSRNNTSKSCLVFQRVSRQQKLHK